MKRRCFVNVPFRNSFQPLWNIGLRPFLSDFQRQITHFCASLYFAAGESSGTSEEHRCQSVRPDSRPVANLHRRSITPVIELHGRLPLLHLQTLSKHASGTSRIQPRPCPNTSRRENPKIRRIRGPLFTNPTPRFFLLPHAPLLRYTFLNL